MVENFLSQAKEDLPVYINHVREAFSQLKDDEGEEIILVDRLVLNEEDKVFRIRIPALDGCSQEAADFIRSYLNAEIYNILSAIGGKYITFYVNTKKEKLIAMLRDLDETFGIRQSRSERRGFGKCINVIDRMIAGMDEGTDPKDAGFHFVIRDLEERPGKYNQYIAEKRKSCAFREAINGVWERILCGIDIGGTDIKAVLAINGALEYIKEFDWFPAAYTTADEIIDPIVDLARLLAVKASYDRLPEESRNSPQWASLGADLEKAMEKDAPEDLIKAASLAAEELLSDKLIKIDAIGMCFPDVVVRDRIVGGETYKTRGIRNNETVDYEEEFAKFIGLNEKLKRYASVVKNTNDGPMAAFTAAVEMALSGKDFDLGQGIFAHTLGTELGTGWVDEEGKIPEIPLEIYNFIIDLGSFVQKEYEPDDVRSINNFNTNLAGTLQKYASQSGAFRLAMKYFREERSDLIQEMEQRGYIIHKDAKAGKGLYVELEKRDMRKPFLEFLMALPEREYDAGLRDEDDPTRKIWMDIGEYLAVTWCETERILNPEVKSRILFGRLVKNKMCFDLMRKGAERIKPGVILEAADETMSYSPLMKQLERNREYTVAQFAQAVGAVYYGNSAL